MADSRTSNVIKNSGASLLNRLVHTLIQFGMRTVFIYFLGNEYTGISGLFTDILQVLSLMELGLDTSMVYALFGPVARQDKKRICALMTFCGAIARMISCFRNSFLSTAPPEK